LFLEIRIELARVVFPQIELNRHNLIFFSWKLGCLLVFLKKRVEPATRNLFLLENRVELAQPDVETAKKQLTGPFDTFKTPETPNSLAN